MANAQKHGARGESRRDFLKRTATVTAGIAAATVSESLFPVHGRESVTVVIVPDHEDPAVGQAPVQWAVGQLQAALETRGLRVRIQPVFTDPHANGPCVLVSGSRTPLSREVLGTAGATVVDVPESLT